MKHVLDIAVKDLCFLIVKRRLKVVSGTAGKFRELRLLSVQHFCTIHSKIRVSIHFLKADAAFKAVTPPVFTRTKLNVEVACRVLII